MPAWRWVVLSTLVATASWFVESYRAFSSLGGPFGFSFQESLPLVLLGVVAELVVGAVVAFTAHVVAQRGARGRRWFVTVFHGFGMLFGGLTLGVRWTQVLGFLAAAAAIVLAWWDEVPPPAASQR